MSPGGRRTRSHIEDDRTVWRARVRAAGLTIADAAIYYECPCGFRHTLGSSAGAWHLTILERSRARIEDQPPPVPNEGVPVWKLVVADMEERDQVGRARYGTPLQTFNGRDALIDAYQEGLDLVVYLRQAIAERDDQPSPMDMDEPQTGMDLRVLRTRLGLTQQQVADRLGCSRVWVSQMEHWPRVGTIWRGRYRTNNLLTTVPVEDHGQGSPDVPGLEDET